jgi:hypothetical protein
LRSVVKYIVAIAKVTAFLWQVRLDFDTLGATHQDERNRAEATQRIGLLVRLVNDSDTIPEVLVKRRCILAAAGKKVGLSDLHGQLRQFVEDLGIAALASPDHIVKSVKEGPDVRKDIPEDLRADICRARLIAFGKLEF